MDVEVVYCVSYDSTEMNSLTCIFEASSFIKEEMMGKRVCLFKTVVDIANSSLKLLQQFILF